MFKGYWRNPGATEAAFVQFEGRRFFRTGDLGRMDEEGYLRVDERLHTNIPGVFAAGETHDRVFRQAVVSAGYGCMAQMEAEKFLANLEHHGYPG